MPESDYDRHQCERYAAIDLLHTAAVHLFLRTPRYRPQRHAVSTLDFDTATDVERYRDFTQHISNWIGQPERCALAPCRRAKLCQGNPAACWREEPPPSAAEIEEAKRRLKAMFSNEMERRRAAEPPSESVQPR